RSFLRSPVHTYAAPGTYTVTLRARGDCGEDTEVRAGLIAVAAPVAADFSASVTRGCAPDFQVVFTDLSRGDGLSAWSWDFGDGETSAERSPAHVYREPGVYTVTLAARGVCGEDVESKAGLILVDGPPAAPEEVRYPAAGFAGDTVTVRWPESARAARYLVEAAVAGERDWFEACQVEDDPALRELSCSVALDETGSWRFRVRALNDCGESVPLEGPPLEVAPPAVFASWPLDACVALDVEKGNDGRLSGTVTCGTDRFGDARTALRFRGDGLVQGSSLPPWDGDFSASLWFLPREAAGSSAAGARMLELHRDDGRAAAPPLRLSWIDRELAVTVAHGDGGGIRFDGVGRAWHHLAVTRARGTLTAFLDGVAGAPMADSGGLGDGFAMGGAPGGTALFVGNLDEVLYESRARSPDDVASLILGRPGTVLLRGQTLPAVSLSPGGRAEVLRLPLRTGSPRGPQGFALKVLRLTLRDLASEPGGGFDFVARAALLERSRCDGAAPATEEVGVFRVVPVSQAAASLELALSPGRPLPAPGDACFSVEIEVGPHALARDRVVQLVLETPDELSVSDGALAAFVAGPRRAGAPSLEGARVHVLNQPPELRFSLEALPETVEARSPVEDAELHEVLLAAGSTEGVVIERLVYHALEDARVDAIRSAALVLEEPAGDRKVADGLVDLAAQEVRFEGLALEVPAAGAARLSLRGDLEVARKKPGAALGAVVPTPAAPGAAGGALRGALAGSAALCALAGLAVALARARPARPRLAFRLAGALCLWAFAGLGLAASGCGPAIIGAGVAVGVIASSDSGGGHGGGPAFTARIQLGIVGPEDLSAKGATSGAPAVLDLGEGGIAGPLYEVKGR
ncbi:MAG: PKD domain-containing protein, partial [Planctomycetes bacterium]|nr:PKD domain-containing protein [Planctomycetota bacterium]